MLSFYGNYSLADTQDDNYLHIYIDNKKNLIDSSINIRFNIADCSNNTITPIILNYSTFAQGLVSPLPSGYLLYPYKYSKNVYPYFYSFHNYTDLPLNIDHIQIYSGNGYDYVTKWPDGDYFQIGVDYNLNDCYSHIFGSGNTAYMYINFVTLAPTPAPTTAPSVNPSEYIIHLEDNNIPNLYSTLEPDVVLDINFKAYIDTYANNITYNLTRFKALTALPYGIQSAEWDYINKNLVIKAVHTIIITNITKETRNNPYVIYQDCTANVSNNFTYCMVENPITQSLEDHAKECNLINLNISDQYFVPSLKVFSNVEGVQSFTVDASIFPIGQNPIYDITKVPVDYNSLHGDGNAYNVFEINPDILSNNNIVNNIDLCIKNIRLDDSSYNILQYNIIYGDCTESFNILNIKGDNLQFIYINLYGTDTYRYNKCNNPVQLTFTKLLKDSTSVQSYLNTSYNYVDTSYSYIQ